MSQQNQTFANRFLSLGASSKVIPATVLVVLGTALLTVAAKVQVPFYPVPMTLQSLAVLLIGAAYGWRLAALTVLAYLGEGLLGLPVFTTTPPLPAGPLYFMGPTGGFLIGFIASAAISGFAVERGLANRPFALFGAMLLGEVVLFAVGLLWLSQFAHLASGSVGLGFAKAWNGAVAPFLLGDLVKTALAAALTSGLYVAVRPR